MRGQIEIQDRDIAILRTLFESRLMTLAQAAALHFEGRKDATKKRVQKLKAANLIAERQRRAYHPSILHLTKRGFDMLFQGGHIGDYPRITWANMEKRAQVSESTLRHELQVMDVKSALVQAVSQVERYQIAEFSTWPVLSQFAVLAPVGCTSSDGFLRIKPDGFLRIHERLSSGSRVEHTFFLEVDRGNESLSILAQKAQGYREHYRRGGYAQRCGLPKEQYTSAPFCVLVVFDSQKRLRNVAEKLYQLQNPILQQVWLTTMKGLIERPLEAIWLTPKSIKECGDPTQAEPVAISLLGN